MEEESIIYVAYLKKIGTILINYGQVQMEYDITTIRVWPQANKADVSELRIKSSVT
jgi:hypothetical protein